MTTKMFGSPIKRLEDPRLLRGEGRYLDDLGQTALEAAFVRSPHAHARVTEVDVSGALDVDGVVAVYTYDDLAEDAARTGSGVDRRLPLLIPHPALHAPRTGYPLAKDEVNHVGEAVAVIVARSKAAAQDAVELVDVELTIGQERFFVGAVIADRENVVSAPVDADRLAVRDHLSHLAICQVVEVGDRLELRHQ